MDLTTSLHLCCHTAPRACRTGRNLSTRLVQLTGHLCQGLCIRKLCFSPAKNNPKIVSPSSLCLNSQFSGRETRSSDGNVFFLYKITIQPSHFLSFLGKFLFHRGERNISIFADKTVIQLSNCCSHIFILCISHLHCD